MGREGVAVAKEIEMGALKQEPLERLGRTGCNYPQEAEERRGAAASSQRKLGRKQTLKRSG